MSTKKVSYMSLLKEAISEFDTSKNVDVKGPFLDPILGYDGGGELPTHKDAASILERYYFNEENDPGVKVEHKDDAMPEVPPKDDNAAKSLKKDIEQAVADDETPTRDAAQDTKLGEDADVEADGEELVEGEELSEADDIENAVIEKLISEMEDLDEDLTEEVKIGDDNQTEPAGAPDEDLEKTLPDRKDDHDASVKANKFTEAEEMEASDDDDDDDDDDKGEEGEEEKELDVDAEVKKEGLGPDLRSSAHDNPNETAEDLEEAFAIFKEAIEEDDDDGIEKKD